MMFHSILIISLLLTLSACAAPVADDTSSQTTETTTSMKDEHQLLLESLPKDSSATDWNLILVNPDKALAEDFEVDLRQVDNGQEVDARIVDAWESLRTDAEAAGYQLFFASGYRSVELQEANFDATYQSYIDQGLSEDEAMARCLEYLTVPGHSEHHTGLALDVVDGPWINAGNGLDEAYAGEASYKWMGQHMADYGFILRYPENKEDITQILFEPWHIRYVGVENAHFMNTHDLSLEEYVALLTERDGK